MIPTGTTAIPYFLAFGEDKEAFDAVLERERELTEFEVIDELDGWWLHRAGWDPSADTFVQTMVTHDAILQEAGGDADSWTFQLRFADSHELSEFHTHCREQDIAQTVESLYNPIERRRSRLEIRRRHSARSSSASTTPATSRCRGR